MTLKFLNNSTDSGSTALSHFNHTLRCTTLYFIQIVHTKTLHHYYSLLSIFPTMLKHLSIITCIVLYNLPFELPTFYYQSGNT